MAKTMAFQCYLSLDTNLFSSKIWKSIGLDINFATYGAHGALFWLSQEAGLSASKWTMTPRRECHGRGAAGALAAGAGEPGPGKYDLEVPEDLPKSVGS